MARLRSMALLATISFALSCSGDTITGPPEDINDGGLGNQTLLVQAEVEVDNASGGFVTDFEVDVWDADGQRVTDAEVVIEGGFGARSLTPNAANGGRYEGELTGAAWGTLRLNVERGGEFVRDVVLGNIGIHVFISPEIGDTVSANAPLTLRWFRDSPAPIVWLWTSDVFLEDLEDTGEFVLPASQNPTDLDQWFEIERRNEVQIAGGLNGSYFRIEVTNRVEPVRVE